MCIRDRVYPDIDFSISRNQTELLDYTISNLQQNLTLGFLFICLVAVLFLGDVKSPLVIGLSMVCLLYTSGPGVVSLSSPQDVIVEMTGETYDKLETILQQVSYVKLSAIPLLSRIKKIQIADERIYLWDLVAVSYTHLRKYNLVDDSNPVLMNIYVK